VPCIATPMTDRLIDIL